MMPVVELLDELNVPYHVGGSLASSIYGVPRSTADVDIIADLHPEHVEALVKSLRDHYYVDHDRVRSAILERRCWSAQGSGAKARSHLP